MLDVESVHALDGGEVIGDVDAADDQDVVFELDLTPDVGREAAVAGVDVARLQRTSEGAGQSAAARLPDADTACARRDQVGSKGLTISMPQARKSRTLRVATAKPCSRAIAAICPSGTLSGRPSSLRLAITSPY
jgi:hypothetical protein